MADPTNRLAGLAYLAIDGQSYAVAGEFEYKCASPVRESLIGMDGVHGYKETPGIGHIKATLRDLAGLSVGSIGLMTNVTITVELANGKTIVGRNCWCTEAPVASAADGTVPVTWESPDVTEN